MIRRIARIRRAAVAAAPWIVAAVLAVESLAAAADTLKVVLEHPAAAELEREGMGRPVK